ncbi:unnamed protein product [Meloidogyne enterolobii]|uniref:Uncharacterized protein n=1 Tax=Meloidogyne enterolobii TaxID=390850 RepID=A0ACB0XRP1_MELEN
MSLREQHKTLTPKSQRNPILGELVIIFDENLPVSHWRTAVISKLINNKDNIPDVAEVRFPSGRVVKRSVNHLLPLETSHELKQRLNPEEPQSMEKEKEEELKEDKNREKVNNYMFNPEIEPNHPPDHIIEGEDETLKQ